MSFGHCVVCSSSIYRFWLPLWYLQTLLVWRAELSDTILKRGPAKLCLIWFSGFSKCDPSSKYAYLHNQYKSAEWKLHRKTKNLYWKTRRDIVALNFELTVTYHKAVIDKEFLFYVTATILKGGRSLKGDNLRQVWLNLVQWFQRRRFKCECLWRTTDGRQTTSDGKSNKSKLDLYFINLIVI